MYSQLFHIFRNTPLGRETMLQSLYFCCQIGATPAVYIPQHTKFLMYFENDVVQVDLDESYLKDPDTARAHAEELVAASGLHSRFLKPKNYTASTLPDIPTNFDFMCCPRSISDLSSKIGLGYIGPRVRRIVTSARFPVLITSPVYKPWESLAVFFGGSANALNALKLGLRIHRQANIPLRMFTQAEKHSRADYEEIIGNNGLTEELGKALEEWVFFERGDFGSNLYQVPHNALVIMGAYGHSLIRDLVFGSKMEKIQSTISNNFLVVGPHYTAGMQSA
ncbi:MAG: universal stress protein [Desulfosarcina sp.]|nr:universal stress protein [Desulfobacterales bacterium]